MFVKPLYGGLRGLLVAVSVCATLAACSGGGGGGGGDDADTTPPVVETTTPVDQAVDVVRNAVVTIRFSEPMDPATLNEDTILMDDVSGNPAVVVPGTVTYDPATNTATFDPDDLVGQPGINYDFSGEYEVTVVGGNNGVKDTSGNAMVSDYVFSFVAIDMPPPPGP